MRGLGSGPSVASLGKALTVRRSEPLLFGGQANPLACLEACRTIRHAFFWPEAVTVYFRSPNKKGIATIPQPLSTNASRNFRELDLLQRATAVVSATSNAVMLTIRRTVADAVST